MTDRPLKVIDSAEGVAGVRHRFEVLLTSIPAMPPREIDLVQEMVDVREWEIALENLITQIVDLDVPVEETVQRSIREFAEALHLRPRYLELVDDMIVQPSIR